MFIISKLFPGFIWILLVLLRLQYIQSGSSYSSEFTHNFSWNQLWLELRELRLALQSVLLCLTRIPLNRFIWFNSQFLLKSSIIVFKDDWFQSVQRPLLFLCWPIRLNRVFSSLLEANDIAAFWMERSTWA